MPGWRALSSSKRRRDASENDFKAARDRVNPQRIAVEAFVIAALRELLSEIDVMSRSAPSSGERRITLRFLTHRTNPPYMLRGPLSVR